MDLSAEIADVSSGGSVHFQDTLLANVTLQYGNVVGTTTNDGTKPDGFQLVYYDTDDDAFDVPLTPVPVLERGMFGEEFRIDESTLSDCLYLKAPPDFVMPGCPERSIQARAAVLQRNKTEGASAPADFSEAVWNPRGRPDDLLLDEDSLWLLAVREELGALPSREVTEWPEFVLPTVRNPVERTQITRPWQELPEGQLLGTLQLPPERDEELWPGLLVVVLPLVATVAAAAAAAAVWAVLPLHRVKRARRCVWGAQRQMSGNLDAAMVRRPQAYSVVRRIDCSPVLDQSQTVAEPCVASQNTDAVQLPIAGAGMKSVH